MKKIKIKLEHAKNFNRKIDNEIKKLSDGFFLKKYEKLLLKNHKASNKNKSINSLNTCIANNSLINLHHKVGSHLYQNLLITDRPLYKKLKNKVKLNQNILSNKIKNSNTMKMKTDINKKLSIESRYFSNGEKYDISGDNYSKKYKNYLSSLPSSTRKMNNTSSCTKKDKKVFISSKNAYIKLNDAYNSKYQYKANQKINKNNTNNKINIDDFSANLIFPNSTQAIHDESISYNLESNRRFSSDLNSFDNKTKEENKSNYSKIIDLKKKNLKAHGKIFIKKDNILKSIKVNKNNYLEKTNKNCFNNILGNDKINIKIHPYLKTNINISSNNKIKTFKRIGKNKGRLQSCKFTNEQIQKFEKELFTESNLKFRKLAERVCKKNSNLKINQSSSIIDKKNVTFFGNYIKDNKININSHINSNRFYTNSNLSSYINNESDIIRNNTNINFMKNYNNSLTTNQSKKKKKSFLYKKTMLREEDLLRRIKMKIKSKALTTLNSKENSKSNIFYESIINTSINKNSKHNYTSSNINNKNINEKKIFINNIINVNNTNENKNNIENNIITNNNNCYSYRISGGEKIKYFKNNISYTLKIKLFSNY
jgi:hypothetical protein